MGPTSIVSFRNKPIGRGVEVVNARSCFDCHENGIIRKNDELRNHILTSNAFNLDQREVLLEMYPEQEVIDKYYKQDSEYFIEALDWLGVTQKSAAGTTVSLRAPQAEGGGEIVTYLADLQFRTMDLEAVARAFYLTPGEFADRINTLGDSHLIQLTTGWMNRFNAGLEIARVELDEVYADLLPRMTDYDPFRYVADGYVQEKVVEKYEEIVVEAIHKEAEYVEEKGVYEAKKEKPYEPDLKKVEAYVPPKVVKDPLHLSLAVPYVNVKVNDLLEFDISANKRCELQVLYVEETKNVEELPPEVLGPAFLEAGEVRRIPYPGSGFQLRFDTPGKGETMIAFCRAGGLGNKRIDAGYALNYAKEHFQPLSRGIVIERTKEVAKDEGQSAVHAVTFQVSK